jgi:hypothetical protein
MAKITEKLKQKITGAKDKAKGTADKTRSKAKEGVSSTTTKSRTDQQDRQYEGGGRGTKVGKKDDPLTEYREKEPMTPAKINEHEPTAVKREMSEKISHSGQTSGTSLSEKARSGMTKGTAGAAETGSEYEQGVSGANT